MPDVVTDTHALIWYLEDSYRLSPAARERFDACDRGEILVHVPTICLIEIVYLQEKGRISASLKNQFDAELKEGTSGLRLANLTPEVADAVARVSRNDVPDMSDRIIAATALHLNLPLVSRDRKIKASGIKTIW